MSASEFHLNRRIELVEYAHPIHGVHPSDRLCRPSLFPTSFVARTHSTSRVSMLPKAPPSYLAAVRYALGFGVLVTLVILSLARVGASMLPLVSWPLHFAIWLGAYKYAYEILFDSAQGRDSPPEIHDLVEPGLASNHGWLQASLLAGSVAVGWLLGPATHVWIGIALGLLLPPLLVTLTVSHSILRALSPLAWLKAVALLGADYPRLLPATLIAAALQANAAELFPFSWPRPLAAFCYYALAHFALMVAYRLIGAFLYQRGPDLEGST